MQSARTKQEKEKTKKKERKKERKKSNLEPAKK
jgi:hypothetical protein